VAVEQAYAREVISVDLRVPAGAVDAMHATLDTREREHAAARHDDARRRYVVAHGALRAVLAARTGADARAITYRRQCAVCGSREHGRPELVHDGGPSFNLSHSGDVAVIAVATERVGVDVEVVRDRRYRDEVAHRIMRDDEFEEWSALPPADRTEAFLRTWTAKEAYLKHLGVGITRALRDVQPSGTTTWSGWPAGCVTTVAIGAAAPVTWERTAFVPG
jgi:4'-phosphopantetheinyl transferase